MLKAEAAQVINKLWCWIGTGESKPTPQPKIFSHQCGGHLQPVGG